MLYDKLPRPINKIFIDLDDVLVDFIRSAYDLTHRSSAIVSVQDLRTVSDYFDNPDNDAELWGALEQAGSEWWANLPNLPWASDLLEVCNKVCSDTTILTSPGKSAEAAAGKLEWSLRTFGENKIFIAYQKYMCSGPGNILIDDMDKFIKPWEDRGGFAIKFRTEWGQDGYYPEEILEALKKYSILG